MLIDAHNHPEWYGYNLEKFMKNVDEYGIDKTWILSWECPENEYNPGYYKEFSPVSSHRYPVCFSKCLKYKEAYPDRFILGYAPDPRRPDAIDRLKSAIDTYDVKVYGEFKLRMMLDNPDAVRMFRFCGEQGLPVVVHIQYETLTGRTYPRSSYWYGGGMEAFERAIALCPETTFIGHAQGFWANISGDSQCIPKEYPSGKIKPGGKLVEMMREYPNLYCDISAKSGHNALSRDVEFTLEFLDEFQDRVLYARDIMDNRHRELFEGLSIPKAVLEKIYYGNAQKLI